MSSTPDINDASSLEPSAPQVKKILFTQQQLEQIKQQLLRCTDSLTQTPSWFTQGALFWGTLNWWQKTAAAVVLMLPVLIMGVAAQIALLSAIGCCLLGFSAVIIAMMENHQKHHISHIGDSKATILSLADLLGTIIQNLATTSNQLAEELAVVHEANKLLSQQCKELEAELIRLKSSNQHLDQNQQQLLKVQKKLHTTITTIDSTVVEQSLLLQKSQSLLEETTTEYKKNQLQLATTVTELSEVKEVLSVEIYKAQRVTETLNKAVRLLSDSTMVNQQQREQFFTRLNALINNQESHFDAFAKNLVESGQQLAQAAHDIKANNCRFTSLLNEQEQLINRLALLKTSKEPSKIAPALKQHGFYASDLAVESLNTNKPLLTLAVG